MAKLYGKVLSLAVCLLTCGGLLPSLAAPLSVAFTRTSGTLKADIGFVSSANTKRKLYVATGDRDFGETRTDWPSSVALTNVAVGVSGIFGVDLTAYRDAYAMRFFLVDDYDTTSYVQDGLTAQWDAIENAGRGHHDASKTTVVKDLAGTYDLTLEANTSALTVNADHIVIPSGNNLKTSIAAFANRSDARTAEVVAHVGDDFEASGARMGFLHLGNDAEIFVRGGSGYWTGGIFVNGKNTAYYMATLVSALNSEAVVKAPHSYSLAYLGYPTGSNLRIDDQLAISTGWASQNATTADGTAKCIATGSFTHNTTVGIPGAFNARANIYFSTARVYNRVLTAEERTWNAQVDRCRYCGQAVPVEVSGCLFPRGAFRYATWNIGHFALGQSNASSITVEEAPAKLTAYTNYLNGIGADWLGVNEYSTDFTADGSVASTNTVFGQYPIQVLGPHQSYQWNSAFASSRFEVLETVTKYYDYHKQNVYYIANRVRIDGEYEAWFVQTHHDWESEEHRVRQTDELISDFADKPRVVISGDFNIATKLSDAKTAVTEWTTLARFQQAGYHTVNTGSLGATTVGGFAAIDHIHVRGFVISDGAVIPATGLSDHHAAACQLTPIRSDSGGKKLVNVPANPPDQEYTGSARTPAVTVDSDYAVTWQGDCTQVGAYTGTATLTDPETTCWADGTTAAKLLTFHVFKNLTDGVEAAVRRTDDASAQADLFFPITNVVRRLYVVYGTNDTGSALSGWAGRTTLGLIPAGTASATVTLPQSLGDEYGVFRFLLVPDLDSYVQDGLVLQWDAQENTGRGEYDGSATTWKDLKGNIDLPTEGWEFRGDRVFIPSATQRSVATGDLLTTNDVKTVEICGRTDGTFKLNNARMDLINYCNDGSIAFRGNGGNSSQRYWILGCFANAGASGENCCYVQNTGSSHNTLDQILSFTTYSAKFAPLAANSTLHVDGDLFSDGITGAYWKKAVFTHTDNITVGGDRANLEVTSVRVYNRVLTDAERMTNRQVDAQRLYGTYSVPLSIPAPFEVTLKRKEGELRADFDFGASVYTRRQLRIATGNRDYGTQLADWPQSVVLTNIAAGSVGRFRDLDLSAYRNAYKMRFFLVDVYDTTSYVQDGLTAQWDAQENAGRGQHDAAKTTGVKDLAGTYDLTLEANTSALTVEENQLVIPSGNNLKTSIAAFANRSDARTAEVVAHVGDDFKATNERMGLLHLGNDAEIFVRGGDGYWNGAIFVNGSNNAYYMVSKTSALNSETLIKSPQSYSLAYYGYPTGSNLRINDQLAIGTGWASLYGTTSDGTAKCIANSTFTHGTTVGIPGAFTARANIYFSTARVYNRVLTAEERRWNTQVDRCRYCGQTASAEVSKCFHRKGFAILLD